MGVLDHWQPVARSSELRKRPLAVTIAGHPIAVYRTTSGTIGALADYCPHRRMKLSAGDVVGETLRCRYHGWTFDCHGRGESPGAPKLTACAASFDAREEHGLVWVKSRESSPPFPQLDTAGFIWIGELVLDSPAPLELVVDNFNEIEHSGTVHANFGYDLARMDEVKVAYEVSEDSLRVVNVGPTKRLSWLDSLFVGVRRGDLFHDQWTTYFSPMYSVFEHWWTSPEGRERMVRWRVYVFYVPLDDRTTRLFAIAYARSRWPVPGGGMRTARLYIRRKTAAELRADVEILSHLADYDTSIEGLKLSRFDKSLGLTRERIARIYRGEPAGSHSADPACPAVEKPVILRGS
jgi:phenylpropionate dioxygenase-like ring-hydroxylating dioxygenase large terminal subunit